MFNLCIQHSSKEDIYFGHGVLPLTLITLLYPPSHIALTSANPTIIRQHKLHQPAMEGKTSFGSADHDEKPRLQPVSNAEPDSKNILGHRGSWEATTEDAKAANAHEHSLTVRQALKAYPWAVFWSLIVSMSIIMEGYDTILIGSLYAYPSYARRFGAQDAATGTYQIEAKWQSAMGSGPQAGAIVGALFNGFLIQRYGYRPAFMFGVILMAAFVFVSVFGMSVELQAVGQILCG